MPKTSIAPHCHLIFATNDPMSFAGATDAFLRRVFVVPFEYEFYIDTGKATIDQVLEYEKLGIVQKIIAAYRSLRTRNFCFSAHYGLNAVVDTISHSMDVMQGPGVNFVLQEWAVNNLEPAPNQFIGIEVLWEHFNAYQVDSGRPNEVYPNSAKFSKDLRAIQLDGAVFENRVVKRGHGYRAALVNYKLKGEE